MELENTEIEWRVSDQTQDLVEAGLHVTVGGDRIRICGRGLRSGSGDERIAK